ncbi:MAG: O-antigen ligase family protein [Ruminococcus flavefaciens]|nr:O-antigen ligase family protein [Ruminococcus flavefaciens]
MNRIINRRQAICGTVWLIVLCVVFALWPLRLVKETVVSDSRKQMVAESEAITPDYVVQQMFIAQYDRLKNIDIYFTDGTIGEEFNFVLYDAAMNMIMQQVINTEDMKTMPGYCTVQINIDVEVGREYYFLIQGIDAPFHVAYEDTEESGNRYNGTLYYGNVEDTQHCMIASYEYEVPLRKGKTLVCDALFVLSGILVTYFTGRYYRERPEKNVLVTVEQTVKAVCNPFIVLAGVIAFLAVWPCKMFTGITASIIFYEVSVLLAVGIALYAVNHNRTGYATDRTILDLLKGKWQNYLQSALFAGAIWSCCNYMNGLYEIHHSVAYRQMLIFFALAVIVTYRYRDIFNLVNFVYIVSAAAAGHPYCVRATEALENPEELDFVVIKLTAWAGVLAGLVIIGTVRSVVRRRIRDVSVWYGILVAVFFALIILYRNTRGWPIYLVCAFTLFYLNMAAWNKKAALLNNICNGILFHFGAMVVYCLLHRPYMFFIYYRYPFLFHTVTMSAVYLSLVVCAALVKFLDAYRKQHRLAAVYKELLVFGVSLVYLILTLSRTGYLAVVVMALMIIPVMCFSLEKRWRSMLHSIGMMALALVLCFPVVFSAQRMIPAVVARPEAHEVEEFPTEIMHGRDTDSRYYITIQRFIQVFQMKILGIPEEKSLRAIYMVVDAGEELFHNPLIADIDEILLVSAEDTAAGAQTEDGTPEGEEQEDDSYTNGRLEIFKLYYNNLNKTGHDDMGIMEVNGHYNVHAHNIYLQVAYDHGIYVGIVFILLGAGTLVQAAVYFHKRKEDRACAALPLAILILFAIAGLTEWIFHPCSPIAYCLLLTLAPLLADRQRTA